MGGHGSYSSELKEVPLASRTHNEAISRIDGHKILIQKQTEAQMEQRKIAVENFYGEGKHIYIDELG